MPISLLQALKKTAVSIRYHKSNKPTFSCQMSHLKRRNKQLSNLTNFRSYFSFNLEKKQHLYHWMQPHKFLESDGVSAEHSCDMEFVTSKENMSPSALFNVTTTFSIPYASSLLW